MVIPSGDVWILSSPLERTADPVIVLPDMPISPSRTRRESPTPEVEANEPHTAPSQATVNLSVQRHFVVGVRAARPMSGALLLTLEWE